jgi:hypothetical protein
MSLSVRGNPRSLFEINFPPFLLFVETQWATHPPEAGPVGTGRQAIAIGPVRVCLEGRLRR